MKTRREPGLFNTVIMGLSGAIGFEIFVLLDYAYFHLAAADIVWALLVAGLVNLLIMLSYCELSAAMPEIGGEYTYIKNAYGGFIAFMSGCFRWIASIFAASLAAVSFTQQITYLLWIAAPTLHTIVSTQTPLVAITIVALFALLEIRGVKEAGSVIVVAFIVIFVIFIISGLLHTPISTEPILRDQLDNLSGVFAATVYIFPMFFGMRALIAGAAQIKRPERNIPIGILLSALLVIPLYVALAFVATGAVSPEETQLSAPLLNVAAERILGFAGGILFAIAGMVASLSALGTSLAVQSSIVRGMSRDGYLPKILLSTHRRLGTHHVAILVGSLFVLLFSFLGAVGAVAFLGYAASFGSLLVFALVSLSLLKLRKTKPYMERPFKTPLYPLTPIVGLIMSIALIVSPAFLRDANAFEALLSGTLLTALALMGYYVRMVGRHRLQIALGGISVGLGISIALLFCLAETKIITSILPFIPNYVMLIVSAISIVAGVLNATTKS